jgi:hypothetical protein
MALDTDHVSTGLHGGRRRVDGRSVVARRAKQLTREFIDALGGSDAVDPATLSKVRRAAELVAVGERTRVMAMAGDAVIDDLVRVERLCDSALKRLNLDRRREPAAEQTLQEYAASVAAKASEGDPP